MVLNEGELRHLLAAAADHVSAPRFTLEGLRSRIRRRRAKILGLVSGSLLAVAAIAVAVPVTLSARGTPPRAQPMLAPFDLSYTVAVNGQSGVLPQGRHIPRFIVTPGEDLSIRIGVIVPAHAKVTALWLGVATGAFGSPGRDGQRPFGMDPVLAHTGKPLTPGRHTFRLTWTMPAQLNPRASLLLVAAWETKDARVAEPVAELVTPR
jgi:hypothetical protein